MVAQVAPDRRSATVVSIPRDTWWTSRTGALLWVLFARRGIVECGVGNSQCREI